MRLENRQPERRWWPESVRTFRRDARAATIVEFALVIAPLIALLLAILETSLVYFSQEGLETTAEAAGRLVMTGQAQSAGWSASQFQTQVCNTLPPYMSCSQLMIDVQSSSSFSNANIGMPTITYNSNNGADSNAWQYNVGAAGAIVVVRLMYIWPVPTGPLGFSLANTSNGRRVLMATSVTKTEPYS